MSKKTINNLKVIHSSLTPETATWKDLEAEGPIIADTGNSELYGTELSLGWQPWTPLTLTGSLGWVETEFLNYTAQGEDYSGNEFIFAPRFTGSL